MAMVLVGCSTGPVELLDVGEAQDASCFRTSSCIEEAQKARAAGEVGRAVPYLIEACESGSAKGCRLLASSYAIGSIGQPDPERAASLYRWGCEEAGDGASCHSLGELIRLERVEESGEERARTYFGRACQLDYGPGCHDEAIVELRGDQTGEDVQEAAVEVFAAQCEAGLDVACVNEAYMMAAGRGTARDHGEATERFDRMCRAGDEDWTAHPLAGLTRPSDPDVHTVAEYSPEVACEQLEVLTVGGYEERIIAAVDAESDRLRRCYDEARPDDRRTVGRITVRVGVNDDGDGVDPRIVDDELGLDDLADCVENSLLDRHLEDYAGGAATWETQFGISFVHPPLEVLDRQVGARAGGCDEEAVQMQVSEIFPDLRECGTRHLERHPDDPGAVVAFWTIGPSGQVDDISMTATNRQAGLKSCLEETIAAIEIPPFDGEACPVQVPFLFSGGERLHFSVVGAQ